MERKELKPINGQKSFYGKAFVETDKDGNEILYSYGTRIARRTPSGKVERLYGGWSNTTGRHIRSFCGMNKSEFMKLEHELTPYEKSFAYSGALYR